MKLRYKVSKSWKYVATNRGAQLLKITLMKFKTFIGTAGYLTLCATLDLNAMRRSTIEMADKPNHKPEIKFGL